MNPRKVAKQMSFSPLPAWELMKADYDINYTDTKKKKKKKRENPHILSYLVKSHIADNYSNHLKILKDGSVLGNQQAGAGFDNRDFNTKTASTFEKKSLYPLQN